MPKKYPLIIAVLAVLLVGVSTALVIKVALSPAPAPSNIPENTNTIVNEYSNPNPDNTPEPTTGHDLAIEPFSPQSQYGLSIAWIIPGTVVPEKLVAAEIGRKIPAPKKDSYGTLSSEPTFTKVGTIKAAGAAAAMYVGDGLYRVSAGCDMGTSNCINFLGIADPKKKEFVSLARYPLSGFISPNNADGAPIDYPLTDITIRDRNLMIADLEPPSYIQLAKQGYFLETTIKGTGTPSSNEPNLLGVSADGTKLYAENNDISGKLPNGELIRYQLGIPFFADKRIPAITWNDGTANKSDYTAQVVGGCGPTPRLSLRVADEKKLEGQLTVAGKTINGEDIYLPSETNGKILTDLFAFSTASADGTSFQDFVSRRPVFYWRDPFNRLIEWQRADVQPLAECGKPVVYLYPTQTEKVSVKLGSNIEVTKSEPEYKNGWTVTAEPNGKLTDANGSYLYLYWDGNGASYETPKRGWVVASKDVELFLPVKLAALGLNAKEISDFNEFWLPIVSKSPYARISFVPQAEWSKAAPMSISPAPETVIRVFMDWQPLSNPVSIEPQTLPPTPVRTGFTAVEWGGLLYK